MPRCVDCGTETPRDEMYGPPDELRCRACVQRRFPVSESSVRPVPSALRRFPPVTTAVIALAVVATLAYWSEWSPVRALVAEAFPLYDGQLWRLVTTAFPHADPIHLVFNLVWTWRFGKATEQWMGSLRFAGFFVVTAAGPLAAEFLSGGTGVGLSGVGYALFGFLFALRNEEEFAAEQTPPWVIQMFVVWFFVCIALTYSKILPVANVAHGAGAVIGYLLGWAVLQQRSARAVALVCLLCAVLVAATQYMPWDGRYALHRGVRYAEQHDYARALPWLRQAAQAFPEREGLYDYVRWIELQLKENEKEEP